MRVNYCGQLKSDLGGGLGGGAHLPWNDFAPLLKFSPSPLRTFAPPLVILTKWIFKDNYTSLIKIIKCRHNCVKVIKVRYFFYFNSLSTGRDHSSTSLKIFPPPLTFSPKSGLDCGPLLPNPTCQLSLLEETGVPGGNLIRFSMAENVQYL